MILFKIADEIRGNKLKKISAIMPSSCIVSHLHLCIWTVHKAKVKVMGEVDIESHKVDVASYRLTSLSFHVNRPSHSWDMTFSKFDLENPR